VVSFIVLLFALSIPFWILGAASGVTLLPGLPVSALMTFCPATTGAILVYIEQGRAGPAQLLRRSFDYQRIKPRIWYVPILGLMPLVMIVSYWLMRWRGLPLPRPEIPMLSTPLMFTAFLVGAVGEELGWSGYATDPMQARWGLLGAGIALGLVWAAWHLIPLLQAHRSASWIAGWSLGTVANRLIIVLLFNYAGRSVFAAALYHTMSNVSWQLFPNHGSHYDPRVTGPVIACMAAIGVVVSGRAGRLKSLEPRSLSLCKVR
jgi:membrane protease YdiL (CAAX protease family)